MSLPKAILAIVLAAPVISGATIPADETFVTHEWGTFTSVAGEDGASVRWAPLSFTSDLPCFVNRLRPQNVKLAQGLVRMETPVLYFYPQRQLTFSVHVDFPQGWITEWYPKATRVKPEFSSSQHLYDVINTRQGQIDWDSVRASPGEDPEFPSGKGASHYYAARNTDSAPLRIGEQQEKLIFYRGIGDFSVPLLAKFASDGKIEIHNAGSDMIPFAILFENRDGKSGYRVTRGLRDVAKLDPPELTGDLESLRREMADALVEFGLYRREALAMVETWRDSWFEEGMRVFYIVPRSTVDSLLPLRITPPPTALARVFVGRVEVFSPWVEQTIEAGLAKGDIASLAKFGRFLDPFMAQIWKKNTSLVRSSAAREYLQQAYSKIQQEFSAASCVE